MLQFKLCAMAILITLSEHSGSFRRSQGGSSSTCTVQTGYFSRLFSARVSARCCFTGDSPPIASPALRSRIVMSRSDGTD